MKKLHFWNNDKLGLFNDVNKNKIMRILGVILSFLAILTACVSTKSIPEASPMIFPTQSNTLLWKITGNGITKDCYIFGTMHIIEKDYFIFPESLQKKIKATDQLVMEIANINQMDALKYLMLENGNLKDFFNKKQLDTLYSWAFKNVGMDSTTLMKNFGKMKPFVLSQISTQLAFEGPTESYEKSIQTIADAKKIPNFGLETIAEQMSFFDKLTMEDQVEMVMAGTRSEDNGKADSKEMMQIYKTQNVDALYALIHKKESVFSENEASFLSDRNKRWIPQLKNYFSKGKCFVAVGAAHLGGSEGVLRLLQKEGYTISPVKL
jgi:uncharacterized protein